MMDGHIFIQNSDDDAGRPVVGGRVQSHRRSARERIC